MKIVHILYLSFFFSTSTQYGHAHLQIAVKQYFLSQKYSLIYATVLGFSFLSLQKQHSNNKQLKVKIQEQQAVCEAQTEHIERQKKEIELLQSDNDTLSKKLEAKRYEFIDILKEDLRQEERIYITRLNDATTKYLKIRALHTALGKKFEDSKSEILILKEENERLSKMIQGQNTL